MQRRIMIDHDRLFKELFIACFPDLLQLFLPEVAASLDPDSLHFLDKEIFTESPRESAMRPTW